MFVLLMTVFAAAADYSGSLSLTYDTNLKLQPEFTAAASFYGGQLNVKLKKGLTNWDEDLLLPSLAVEANLFSGSYDFIYKLLGFDWRYEKLLSSLGDRRYFVAHRIKAAKNDWPIYLDFFETSVLKGNNLWLMYNPVPFLPVYLVQHIGLNNKEVNNRDINVDMGFNLGYQFKNQALTFVEVIVDDFPAIPWIDVQLPIMGVTLGYNSPEIAKHNGTMRYALGYTANTRYLHAHYGGLMRYTNSNEFLGDDLGPDAQRFMVAFKHTRANLTGGLNLSFEQHGPGDLTENWLQLGREEAFKQFFLSEIVENKLRLGASLEKNFNKLVFTTKVALTRVIPKESGAFTEYNGNISLGYQF